MFGFAFSYCSLSILNVFFFVCFVLLNTVISILLYDMHSLLYKYPLGRKAEARKCKSVLSAHANKGTSSGNIIS